MWNNEKGKTIFLLFIFRPAIFMLLEECLRLCECIVLLCFLRVNFNQSRTNDDQLAIILAHELSHALLGHSVCFGKFLNHIYMRIFLGRKIILSTSHRYARYVLLFVWLRTIGHYGLLRQWDLGII